MTRSSLMAALLLAPLLAACPAGVPPHPASPADGFTISGSVAGSGGASVTVRAVGAATWTAAVDGNGAFTLTGLPRGEYALSVLGPATRAFTPASRIVTLLDRDVTGQDFTGAAVNVLTGHATGPSGAARLTVAGPVTRVLQSDPGGYYRATGLPDGEYVVHAAAAGATFTPISAVVTLGGGAVVTQDFTGAAVGAPTHAISGGFIGVALPGVRLTLSGAASGVTLSDAAGRYLFEGLADGDYQVTPARAVGHLYRERQRAATVAGADVAGQDFEVWAPAPARFAYVMAQPFGTLSWVIYQYAVAASGAVAALPTPTAPADGPGLLAVHPSGRWLYAASSNTNTITQYAVGDDGLLTPLDPPALAGLGGPRELAFDPAGRWLWVTTDGGATVRRLSVGADGTLALDPSGDLAHAQTSGVVVHPGGQQLFLLGPYGIDAYDVAANGALTPSAGGSALLPPAAAGAVLSRLAVDPKGQFAYATANDYTNHRSWLVPYALGADGSIAPMGSATWAPGWSNVNFGSVEVVIEPSGRFAYAMPDGGAPWPNSFLAQYLVGADGAPSMLPGAPTVGGGHCPAHLAADPTGQFVVIANAAGSPSPGSQADGQVVWQTIGSDGSLVWQGSVPTGMYAQSVVLVAR